MHEPMRLNEREKQYLDHCIDHFIAYDSMPSLADTMQAMALTQRHANLVRASVADKGWIELIGTKYRFSRDWDDRPRVTHASYGRDMVKTSSEIFNL